MNLFKNVLYAGACVGFVATLTIGVVGCVGSGDKPSVHDSLVVKYATMKVIENHSMGHVYAAQRAIQIVGNLRKSTHGFDEEATLDVIEDVIRKNIDFTNLTPADVVLIDTLIRAVMDKLSSQVGDGSKVLTRVAYVLDGIDSVARLYVRGSK